MNLRLGSLVAVLCGGSAAIGQPPRLESIQELDSLRLNRLIWARRAVQDRQLRLTLEDSQQETPLDDCRSLEPLPFVPEGCRRRISLTMLCASDENYSNDCAAFKSLAPAPVRYLEDGETHSLYFGYPFILDRPIGKETEIQASRLRNILIHRADEARKAIKEVIDKHPGWEQYHVGYHTGGTLAYLLGQWAVVYCSRAETALSLINDDNLVKVVTFRELPIFSKGFRGDVVGNLNHLAILPEGQTESEGSLKIFGTIRHTTKVEQGTYFRLVKVDQLAEYSPRRTALSSLTSLSKEARGLFLNHVREHLYSVQQAAKQLSGIIFEQGQRMRRGPYERCARSVGQQLAAFLPLPKGFEAICTVDIPRANVPFKIQCSIPIRFEGTNQASTIPVVSYTARLVDFDAKHRACGQINPLRTTTASPDALPEWEACIKDLALGSDLLTLLSPYSRVGDGNCRFFADDKATKDWATHPEGCVASPDFAAGILRNLYQTFPDLFLQLIPLQMGISPSCQRVIRPVQLPPAERTDARNKFAQLLQYFKQLNSSPGPLALPSRRVLPRPNRPIQVPLRPALFTEHDTPSFRTMSVKIGPGRFVADEQVAAELINCLEKGSPPIINCNYRTNQLLRACPDFCAFSQSPKEASPFCNAMIFCESVQAFVGFASQGFSLLYRTHHAVQKTLRLLDSSEIFQYGIWSYRSKSAGFLEKLGINHGAVFFVERPKLMMEVKMNQLVSSRRASMYPDDDYSCLTLSEEPKLQRLLSDAGESVHAQTTGTAGDPAKPARDDATGSPIEEVPDQERPSEEESEPNEEKDKPCEGESGPDEEENKPSEKESKPGEGENKPGEGESEPNDEKGKPDEDSNGPINELTDPLAASVIVSVIDLLNDSRTNLLDGPAQVDEAAAAKMATIEPSKETGVPAGLPSDLQTM